MSYTLTLTRTNLDNTTFSEIPTAVTRVMTRLDNTSVWVRSPAANANIPIGDVSSCTFKAVFTSEYHTTKIKMRAILYSETTGENIRISSYVQSDWSASNKRWTPTFYFGSLSAEEWAKVSHVKIDYPGVSGSTYNDYYIYYRALSGAPQVLTIDFEAAVEASYYTNGAWKPVSLAKIYQNGAWKTLSKMVKHKSVSTQVPVAALTSNSGPNGYSCGASSTYDTNYPAYLAFNKVNVSVNGWVSARNPSSPQTIWLNLPKAGFLKSVTIYNRTSTDVRGIIAASIQGRKPGETSYTTLVTKTDFPGSTNSQATTVTIPSTYSNTLFDSIRLEITDWHMKGQTDNHICISEIVPEVIYPFGP
jgi:hypothetical protein